MRIKEHRLIKGWTQEDLARHSGLSTRTIQRAECGQPLGSESLKCLAAVFDVSIKCLKQEQDMDNAKSTNTQQEVKLTQTENSAIKYAQSLLNTPKEGEADPLTKVERNAIDYGKKLLNKFKQK